MANIRRRPVARALAGSDASPGTLLDELVKPERPRAEYQGREGCRRMRATGTTLLVVAVLAAQPALASAAVPELSGLSDVVGDTLPDLPVEPPALPELPALPAVPELPEVQLPEPPNPTPVPTPPPLPLPAPVANPAPARPDAPAAAQPAETAGAGRAAPAQDGAARPKAGAGRPQAGSGRARSVPRRAARPTDARRTARDRRAAPAARTRLVGARVDPATASAPAQPAMPRPPDSPPPSFASRVADEVGELIRTIPPAILWALVGSAAIALAFAGDALWQTRRRKLVEAQRAELLDDIGLLSGALLPPVPDVLGGVSVSVAYRPADGPAAGGDFYDVFELEGRRIGVLLGDVSGHGRESVTQAALARYTLRTLLAAGHPPGEALARADELLERDLKPNFVTVIAGVLDSDTGELTYAKAGHAPPIVLGAEHAPDGERPATPLGLGIGDAWPEYSIELREGVSVCLFTDGLEDARVGAARVGRDEIERLLAAQEVPSAGRLIGELEQLADLMSDDAAVVVLSRPAPVEVAAAAAEQHGR
jgi:Stage II sporulation protein E (SpoIIE)